MNVQDPTALAPDELAAAGVVLTGYCHAEMRPTGGAVWKTHSEYLAANPRVDQIQRSAARNAAMVHLGGHDTLAGLRIPRSFPCLGRLRIVSGGEARAKGHTPSVVVCDRCGFNIGVRPEALEAPAGGGW